MNDYLAYFLLAFSSFLASFVASLIFSMLKERSYWSLEKRVKSLENSLAGEAGQDRKQEQNAQVQAALLEAKAILDNKDLDQSAKMQAGLALLAKYPAAAGTLMKLASKYGISL